MAKTETLIDAGPLVDYFYLQGQHHTWARQQSAGIAMPLVTCEAVLSEAFHILENVLQGTEKLLNFIERGVVEVPFSYAPNAERVHALMRTYADQTMSFADACLVRMCETRRSAQVLTTDGDFYVYRTDDGNPLDIVAPS
jgi:predicted nucleic acid-binding protein